ncbi:MAG: radical SAM protein, partial [Verrucomicrobiae bacterium]|nr:radical SAM protein [Verrucomicrobiae bacterium]
EDCCKAVREKKLKNILVSCGSIEERPLRELAQYLDAAHIDLKGFDEETYRKLNSGRLEPVLRTLKVLKSMDVWVEVVNLVVPTYTDKLDVIRRMCEWLVENLGPNTPVHFSRFHPQHKLTYLPPTSIKTLVEAREAARKAGLNFVYIGNVVGVPDAETTFCPNCKRPVVERDVYLVRSMRIENDRCTNCQCVVPGKWKA